MQELRELFHEISSEPQAGQERDEEVGRGKAVAAVRTPPGRGYRSVAVNFAEKELRDSLKAVSGKWNPEEKVWDVPYGLIRGTELEKRIVVEEGKQRRRK